MTAEPDELIAYIVYEVDCPCGDIARFEHDPAGETYECEFCEHPIHVRETL